MNKTTTLKHAEIKVTKEETSFAEIMPNPQIIKNVLNFSKALVVKKTKSVGTITKVMN